MVQNKPGSQKLSYAEIVKTPRHANSNSSTKSGTSGPLNFSSSCFSFPPSVTLLRTELFEVRKTLNKGYGAFAIRDIEIGTVILIEEPLLKAEIMTVYYEFEKLNHMQRIQYCSLAGRTGEGSTIISIFETNRFQITKTVGGIFFKSSRFNHACHPFSVCTFTYDEKKDVLVTTAIQKIKKGHEITISYTNDPSTLPEYYGFSCDCLRCTTD
ncbi:BgTH12-03841 [Blumeria graminis f. sp. triticale]|uniref:BgtA-20428 n=3 Tax=Blumeria graminis TaxID=34373 RepID=A0A9X9PR50_BLUGR|nr:hypothetical protein BGT96224_A20428 [Blumeria graminis f. sp. tritici 96224]CAD6499733.1 BgTH12-03841 [Blumeria graminis f. sp. triticale]VCU39902.1 BgtA-20428 [Blumeria graminis f. sp. tritici]